MIQIDEYGVNKTYIMHRPRENTNKNVWETYLYLQLSEIVERAHLPFAVQQKIHTL